MIPFNRPAPIGDELTYLAQAASSSQTSGDGPFTKRCHALLQEALGVPHALLTTSCTHALEMAALLLRIQPGDEVIVPSFTFVSTANAFALRGAKIVFADVRPDTLNLDELQLPSLITPRTRAIVPVHYAGVACELDPILATAAQHNIAVVEDNAHGLFGKYRGRWLGTFGQLATQSFHETKNFACGEGGALLINDPDLHERAEILREKGTDRSKFFRGQINKYGWVDLGSSYLPSDLLAAFLLAQLEARAKIQAARESIWEDYNKNLTEHFVKLGARTPIVPEYCEQSYHMFYMLMPDLDTRTRFISHMKSRGVLTVFHYLPLNTSTFGATFGGRPGQCPVTEDVSDRLVRLPLFHDMKPDERAQILAAALDFNG